MNCELPITGSSTTNVVVTAAVVFGLGLAAVLVSRRSHRRFGLMVLLVAVCSVGVVIGTEPVDAADDCVVPPVPAVDSTVPSTAAAVPTGSETTTTVGGSGSGAVVPSTSSSAPTSVVDATTATTEPGSTTIVEQTTTTVAEEETTTTEEETTTTVEETTTTAEIICGDNSFPSEGSCLCVADYEEQDGICVPIGGGELFCGINEVAELGMCVCREGYERIDGICIRAMNIPGNVQAMSPPTNAEES